MTNRPYHVLFICRDNSARSVMAEALMNRFGRDLFRAFSAGIDPSREVHPFALEVLKTHGLSTQGLASKDWRQLVEGEERPVDLIIAIHDQSAGEECPQIPGRSLTARWHIADPASGRGTPDEQRLAFHKVFREIENRIRVMACLRPASVERLGDKQDAVHSRGAHANP